VPAGAVILARFLIDPRGVLRSAWRENDRDNWADPTLQLEEIQTIRTGNSTLDTGADHEHRR